jgi:hypothetical protein
VISIVVARIDVNLLFNSCSDRCEALAPKIGWRPIAG